MYHQIDNIIAEFRSLLHMQDAHLETELNRREGRAATIPPPTTESHSIPRHGYAVGNRVHVLNKIQKAATWDNRSEW
jgi:hypothetical protein